MGISKFFKSFSQVWADKAKRFIVIAVCFLIVFFFWASEAKVDQVVHATGRVVASAGTQVIQASDPGIVDAVLVREGQKVKQGQKLVRLQRARAEAAYEDSKAKVFALRAALSRLRAEVFEQPLVFSKELEQYPAFLSNQQELFQRRQKALNEGIAALQHNLRITRQELAIYKPLLAAGDVGQSDVLKLQHQEGELNGQIVNLRNKYFQDAQAEMTKAEEELSTREQELADRAEVLEHTILSAPMSGMVRNIEIRTVGASVRPGDIVMELVPTGDDFFFEAKLKPTDVAFVRMGAAATVKLDAYDYSVYGVLYGKVVYISPDSLTEKTNRGDDVYYLVRVDISHDANGNGQMEILPGMTGQVDIRNGENTVLSFLTKPITKTLAESLRER